MIDEQISQQFIQLSLSDTIAVAQARLNENPGFVAVIFDDEQRPVTIVTADDLAHIVPPADQPLEDSAGQLPPGIITEAALSLEEFANRPEFAALSAGARGAIVFDEDRFAGVLTKATITAYLRDEFEPVSELRWASSDSRLGGRIGNKRTIMYCDAFNHRNELDYYNRRKPPQCEEQTPRPHFIRRQR